MKYRDYSENADVCSWLSFIIGNERWFGDGRPRWKNAQSSDDASELRTRLIKSLRRKPTDPSFSSVSDRLQSCRPNYRCYSGACAECTRALQRYFADQIDRSDEDFICVSLMGQSTPVTRLIEIDPIAMHRRLSRLLKAAGVAFAVGGTDFSLNVDAQNQFEPHWSAHYWLFVSATNSAHWRKTLRTFYPRTDTVRVPVKTRDFDGDLRGAAYAFKNSFIQRQTYVKASRASIAHAPNRNTRNKPLPLMARKELAAFLDCAGLCGRLFYFHNSRERASFDSTSEELSSSKRLPPFTFRHRDVALSPRPRC